MNMWTQFNDAHSGGKQKLKFKLIYIEASSDEAKRVFYHRFGRNPDKVTCTCCGGDYSISEHESLKQLTGFQRGCRALETPRGPNGLYQNDDPVIVNGCYLDADDPIPDGYSLSRCPSFFKYVSLDEHLKQEDVCVIRADEIADAERIGDLPIEGYVWHD